MALGANGPRWRAAGGFQLILDGDVLRVALAVVATPRWAAYLFEIDALDPLTLAACPLS